MLRLNNCRIQRKLIIEFNSQVFLFSSTQPSVNCPCKHLRCQIFNEMCILYLTKQKKYSHFFCRSTVLPQSQSFICRLLAYLAKIQAALNLVVISDRFSCLMMKCCRGTESTLLVKPLSQQTV